MAKTNYFNHAVTRHITNPKNTNFVCSTDYKELLPHYDRLHLMFRSFHNFLTLFCWQKHTLLAKLFHQLNNKACWRYISLRTSLLYCYNCCCVATPVNRIYKGLCLIKQTMTITLRVIKLMFDIFRVTPMRNEVSLESQGLNVFEVLINLVWYVKQAPSIFPSGKVNVACVDGQWLSVYDQ